MKSLLRAVAAVAVLLLGTYGTAQACLGTLSCEKGIVSGPTVVGTYPADITFRIDISYDLPNDRCAVGSLWDSLYGSFSLPADPYVGPGTLWVYNPPDGTAYREYAFTIASFEDCVRLGTVQADGSVTVTTSVIGSSYFEQPFECGLAIQCLPPSQGEGCTLTPGYWKTHSKYGPARYDAAWANVGEDTPFFSSGQSWYQILWYDADVKDAYFILARAYVAAVLNGFAGASGTDAVEGALEFAEGFFGSHTPAAALAMTKAERATVIATAGLLDDYNNGITGPGHCEE